jgi:potassium efflux system protein
MLFFFATAPLPMLAQITPRYPTRADVQSQLDTLNKQKDLSPQEKLIQQDLMETLESLDKIERVKAETAQLRQKVAQAPDAMRKATDALSALSDVDNDDETRKTLATLSLRQLESRVAQLLDDLQTAQADLATYNSQLVSLQTQPERVQNSMYVASQQLQQIRNRLNGTTVGEGALRPTQQTLLLCSSRLITRKSNSNVRAWKAILSCRIRCKNNAITSLQTLIVWNISFSCCRKR